MRLRRSTPLQPVLSVLTRMPCLLRHYIDNLHSSRCICFTAKYSSSQPALTSFLASTNNNHAKDIAIESAINATVDDNLVMLLGTAFDGIT